VKKFILIGLSLIVIASFLLVGCGSENAFAGQASRFDRLGQNYNQVRSNVIANSCNADDTCEINSLVVSSAGSVLKGLTQVNDLESQGQVKAEIFRGNKIALGGVTEGGQRGPFANGDIRTNGVLDADRLDIRGNGLIRGSLALYAYQGQGNAYVCFNSGGLIYRSDTPCR
jgi:hypothetical protein